MSETGLTLKTAIECLEASSWDMEAALQLFQSVKVCWNPFGRKAAHFLTILFRIRFRKRRLYNYDVLPLLILR